MCREGFFFNSEVEISLQWHIQNSCFHACCRTPVLCYEPRSS